MPVPSYKWVAAIGDFLQNSSRASSTGPASLSLLKNSPPPSLCLFLPFVKKKKQPWDAVSALLPSPAAMQPATLMHRQPAVTRRRGGSQQQIGAPAHAIGLACSMVVLESQQRASGAAEPINPDHLHRRLPDHVLLQVRRGATASARASPTPSPAFAVVCRIPRSASTTPAPRSRMWTPSPSACT